jgi:hypothetical protein
LIHHLHRPPHYRRLVAVRHQPQRLIDVEPLHTIILMIVLSWLGKNDGKWLVAEIPYVDTEQE